MQDLDSTTVIDTVCDTEWYSSRAVGSFLHHISGKPVCDLLDLLWPTSAFLL